MVTIGRVLHWLNREAALSVLQQLVSGSGRIIICGASGVETPSAPWVKTYDEVRHSYLLDIDKECQQRSRLNPKTWFAGSSFEQADMVEVIENREVTVSDLIGRALSKSYTCPAKLGDRRSAFEADIRAALEPFASQGIL